MTDKEVIEAILNGQMEAPVMLTALKSFKGKEASDVDDHLSLVGMRHQAYADFLKVKKQGTAVILIPDPANPHDDNAIACYVTRPFEEEDGYTWIRAGYVARNQTHLIRDRSVVHEGNIYRKSHDFWTITADQVRVF